MSYTPTEDQASTVGTYTLYLRVTLDEDSSISWTIPVEVQVSCDFVDDSSCAHEFLPTLDSSLSRIEVCESSPNFQIDFATPANVFGFQHPTVDGEPYFCALMHYGEKRLEIDFDHNSSGTISYVYDPDNTEW